MGFALIQECRQCGAPVELNETDRLLQCPFCNVRSVLASAGSMRYVLPHKDSVRNLFYVPYFRFKGSVYNCYSQRIDFRILDFTQSAAPLDFLPMTLGVRPQAMKMRFAMPSLPGSFLKNSINFSEILHQAAKRTMPVRARLYHRAHIGETVSRVYLPIAIENGEVFDAVTGRKLGGGQAEENDIASAVETNPSWEPVFLAALCPQCGWDLEGEKDSVVLICAGCKTAWGLTRSNFSTIPYSVVKGSDESLYVPFWKIAASTSAEEITSFADFVRSTNQPKVVQKKWEEAKMNYWVPAFKIRPQIFLRVATQLTIAQREYKSTSIMPRFMHPVTMPHEEATQALTIIVANCAANKRDFFPLLPKIRFNKPEVSLAYLPFRVAGNDLISEELAVAINKRALIYGRAL